MSSKNNDEKLTIMYNSKGFEYSVLAISAESANFCPVWFHLRKILNNNSSIKHLNVVAPTSLVLLNCSLVSCSNVLKITYHV